MSQAERVQAETKLGLRGPIYIQYARWAKQAVRGEFGISYKYKMDAAEVVRQRAGNTLLLGGIGFALIFVFALLLGILCAWKEEGLLDRMVCRIGEVTSCIPEFWLSLALILIFSVNLHWFPSSGAYTVGREADFGDRVLHLVLPMAAVVLSHLWYYAYMVRNKVLEEVRADYVLLARAKGLGKHRILFGHCLRCVMPSYFSIMAVSIPHILGGTYIIETVFSFPGLGTLAYESARYKDYNLLMLLCMLSGILVMLCSTIAEAAGKKADPRIRAQEAVKNIG